MDDRTPGTDRGGLDAGRVTRILDDLRGGDASAMDRLFGEVYPELRRMARAVFSGQRADHTLQPTALVNEACLKMVRSLESIQDRRHFFVVAGRAMRQILTDHARAKLSDKRGGDARRLTLDLDPEQPRNTDMADVLALDEAIEHLASLNERHARVVELRVFGGLSVEETALALDVSPRTVDGDWAMAKAWLTRKLAEERS